MCVNLNQMLHSNVIQSITNVHSLMWCPLYWFDHRGYKELKTRNSQRHEINTFKDKPVAASAMELYINDLRNQIEFNRQFFQ